MRALGVSRRTGRDRNQLALGGADLFEIWRSLSVYSPLSPSVSNLFLFLYRSSSKQRSPDGSKEKAAPVCRLVSFRKHFLNCALVSA